MNLDWFDTQQIHDTLYLTTEHHFFEGNRCNIWLIKGPSKDVIIDTGLGVSNLRSHLEGMGLIDSPGMGRDTVVICTHVHFDHSGGAHQFNHVFIHHEDMDGLLSGSQTETLNYVKPLHFYQLPYQDFSAFQYKVPPTPCQPLQDGDKIDIGGDHYLEVMHLPGHTKGSIALYYPQKEELFVGDIVYECGDGGALLDWLPNSSARRYIRSAARLADWISQHGVQAVYPGHFQSLRPERATDLLMEYVESKDNECSQMCASCMRKATIPYIFLGCFRCCPC